MCNQLWLIFGELGEVVFKMFHDASVESTTLLAKQGAVRNVLHQSVLEKVGRIGRHSKPIKRELQLCARLAGQRDQKGVGELAPNSRPDLRHFLRRAQPVEPRHERSV